MTKPPVKCIFCGARVGLTKEHIFSRWTHAYILKTKGSYKRLLSTTFLDRSDFQTRKKSGDILDWQVRCVCEQHCNNGWMRKKVDEPAAPILIQLMKGEQVRITPEQQQLIATWATLKAMVSEYDPAGIVTVHYSHRRLMMTKQVPPQEGWAVWIGRFERREWIPRWASSPFQVRNDKQAISRPNREVTYFNSHVFTQVVGELFIQTVHTPYRRLIRNWRFSLPEGGTLIRIWPRTDISVVWPPPPMSDRDADFATGAIKRFLEDSVARAMSRAAD